MHVCDILIMHAVIAPQAIKKGKIKIILQHTMKLDSTNSRYDSLELAIQLNYHNPTFDLNNAFRHHECISCLTHTVYLHFNLYFKNPIFKVTSSVYSK